VQIYGENAPKYVWRPGSTQTRWGSLSAPPDALAAIEGVLLLREEREGKGRKRGGREEGKKGRGEEGKEESEKREGKGCAPPNVEPWIRQ